ncbi:MAG: ATP-binding protein [Chloroflexi bacterium]|nr:ATP-binding protein [Chloroflexota bacterium]
MTFETLVPGGRKSRVSEMMFRQATAMAKEFADGPKGWLVIEGPTGTGKTHLAAAMINAIVDRGEPAKYVSALNIPELVINERNDRDEGNIFTPLLDAPVLAIDDLGAQQSNNWVDAKIDQLLTHRFNGRLATILVLAKAKTALPERVGLKLDDPDIARLVRLTDEGAISSENYIGVHEIVLNRMVFDTFDADGAKSSNLSQKASIQAAKNAAIEFASEFAEAKSWLYLNGPTGVGKTHLAVAIAGVRAKRGFEVRYWSVPDLLDNLRRAYSSPDPLAFANTFDTTRNSELLILDDFGAPNTTDWALEKLFQIVTFRYDRRMPTVIASQYIIWEGEDNRNWGRLEDKHYWDSIRSRLGDTTVVTERRINAPDFRNRNN